MLPSSQRVQIQIYGVMTYENNIIQLIILTLSSTTFCLKNYVTSLNS